jgi:hypothetical protein
MKARVILAQKWQSKPTFYNVPATNPFQHKPNGQHESLTRINHHHMDVLKDDGMDWQGIDWL